MSEFEVKLTAEEAALLDGKVRPVVQKVVDRAKEALVVAEAGLSEMEAAMVAKILEVAREKGKLEYSVNYHLTRCPCCKRTEGYHIHLRTSRYHKKGAPNFNAPITFLGIDLDRSAGIGYCDRCKPHVEPVVLEYLKNMEVQAAKFPGLPHRYTTYPIKECTECGWLGPENEMLPSTRFGRNSGCPRCGVHDDWGLTIIKVKKDAGFAVVYPVSNICIYGGVLHSSDEIRTYASAPATLERPPT